MINSCNPFFITRRDTLQKPDPLSPVPCAAVGQGWLLGSRAAVECGGSVAPCADCEPVCCPLFPRSISPADGWFSFCVLCSPELVSRCLIVSLSERSGCSCFILARWIRPSALQRLKFCCYSAVLSFWPGGFIHFPPFICVFVNLQ